MAGPTSTGTPAPTAAGRARIGGQAGHGIAAAGMLVLIAANMRTTVASVPPLLPDLGLSGAVEATLTCLPLVMFALFAFVAPALQARLGPIRCLRAALVAVLCGLLVRAVGPAALLLAGTAIACAGIAVANVLLPGIVRRRFRGRLGLMMGLCTAAITVGISTAAALAVPIRDLTGSTSVALGCWAIPVLLVLAGWRRAFRAEPEPGAPVAAATPRGDEAHVDAVPAPASTRTARELWRDPLALCVTGYMGLQSLTFYAPLSWLPTIYREQGLDASACGVLLAVFTLVGVVSNTLVPPLAARRRDQRVVVLLTIPLSMAGVLGVLLAPMSAPLLWMVLMGLGQGASVSLALLFIVLRAPDADVALSLSTIAHGGGFLIGACGPVLMALLHLTGGWTVPLVGLLIVLGIQVAVGLGAARGHIAAGSRG